MKPYVWQEGMTDAEAKDGAYWERSLLALLLANVLNDVAEYDNDEAACGWYEHGEWEGWSRVISILNGGITFHVPDDFDLGDLPQIEPNWIGNSTEEKWLRVMQYCGCKIEENEQN